MHASHIAFIQVMSESVACALEMLDNENTKETRMFIRMIDIFFDCLNVRGPKMGLLKNKQNQKPYESPADTRFKVYSIGLSG